jgi:HEAT repeat protein
MRILLLSTLVLLAAFGIPSQSRAFIEVSRVSPTLGRVIDQSSHIVVLQVDKVSRDKQVVIYKKIADLKGADFPEVAKHKLTDGFHVRPARTVLDWAEPGEIALCFQTGQGCLTCIGGYWYQCSANEVPWWTMTVGRPEMCFAYCGSAAKLRDHVTTILDGKEAVVPALKYEVLGLALGSGKWIERKHEHWATYEAVGAGRLMRGKEWPVWRIKASLKMPGLTHMLIQESLLGDSKFLVGDGPGGPEEVTAWTKALKQDEARVRIEAAEELGLIGPAAKDALPGLLALFEDANPLVRVAAAKAVANIDPKDETALPLLIGALKDKAPKVRKKAAESLGDLGPGAKSAVAALVQAVEDSAVNWAAIDALGQIGPDAEKAVPTLIEALNASSTRGAAVEALGQIGPKAQDAIPDLEKVLQGDDVAVRWATAASLVRIGGPGVKAGVRFLLEASRDPGNNLFDATNILTAPTAKAALPALLDAVRNPKMRDTAANIAVNASVYLKKDQLQDVMKCLQDKDPGVRCVAGWVLHCGRVQLGEPVEFKDVIAVQKETLAASDAWARRKAAGFLGALGPNAKGATEALSALLKDEDEGVRDAAGKALKSIQPR